MTILHLEDSENDALVVEMLLHEEWPDCQIRRVASRAEYESALASEQFDLILCDHQMPGFDGVRALELARTHRPDKPFVFMSGTIGEERAIDAMKRGADDYVIKDRPARLVSAVRQATARRAAELQVREQASLLDKARDAIIATDLALRIRYWNASAERIYGWTAEEVMGRELGALGLDLDPRRLAVARETVAAKDEWQGEFQLRSRQGAKVHVATTWSLVRDAAGQPRTILLIATDVTEAKQWEAQLLRSQRAESIGTLTGGVAHDLNNVLAPILLGTSLLRMESLDAGATRLVDTIEASAQHGAALVRQLLGFARGTDGERVQVEPRKLLEDLTKLLRQTLTARIRVRLEIGDEPRPIRADPTQLKQLLLNLCLNARDAMPDGGEITISAEPVAIDDERARTMPEGKPGSYLHLRVADTGTGIPPEILDRIFDPFFTTKADGKGTGLGLSMVRGIAKGHDGFLHVESTMGRGTTFHIFLSTEGQAAPPPAIEAPRGRGEAILIIDDDVVVRDMLAPYLQQHGYRVAGAHGRQAGLDELRRNPRGISAVITGTNHPGASGVHAIAVVQEIAPGLPTIVCANDAPGPAETGGRELIHACVGKPVEPAVLLTALRKILDVSAKRDRG